MDHDFDDVKIIFEDFISYYAMMDKHALSYLDDDFSGFSAEKKEIFFRKSEWIDTVFNRTVSDPSEKISIKAQELHLQGIRENVVLLTTLLMLKIPEKNDSFSKETIRAVFLFKFDQNRWRINHISFSDPSNDLLERNRFLEDLLKARTLELDEAHSLIASLNSKDALTGIANRALFEETLANEWYRAKRFGHPLAVLLVDIDDFGKYNDRYGVTEGNHCIIEISKIVEIYSRRASDLASRYGNDEFAIVASITDPQDGIKLSEAVKSAVEQLKIPHESSKREFVTVSIGVVIMNPGDDNLPKTLTMHAETALLDSKMAGGNKISIYKS